MSAPKRVGPKLTVKKSCDGCRYEQSEHFAVQSDSGWHVYCAHPVHGEQRKRVSAYSWDTPEWCPITPGDPREALEEHAPLVALAGAEERRHGKGRHVSAPDVSAAVAVLKQGRARYAGMYVPSSHLAWFFGEIDRAIAILEAAPQLLALVRAVDAVTDEYTWREGVLVAVEALPPDVRKMVE